MSMRAGILALLISGTVPSSLMAVTAGARSAHPAAVPVPAQSAAEFPPPQSQSPAPSAPALSPEDSSLMAEVIDRIRQEYVDDIDEHRLVQSAVRGMLSSLDTHSAYLDDAEFEEVRLSTMGSYPGIGIEVIAEDSAVKILHPMAGSPAERAGLRAGDLIVKIDDQSVSQDLSGAMSRVRGRAGTMVHLTVRRPSTGETFNFFLERARVEVHTVTQQMLPSGYGYVRIANFSETTAEDLNKAVLRLQQTNRHRIKGLVLDLRNNPGGVLESAVAVADAFLEQGVIVSADGRADNARFEMDATPGDLLNGAPLVVLVNSGSASASEIVAGALKDHGRAQLVGHRTYGKGTVQTVMPLAHGGAIKLTTSRYFTPSGVSIQGKGIEPDIVSALAERPPPDLVEGEQLSLLERDREIAMAFDSFQMHERQSHLATAPAPP
jgi:carboxyl-terminal processing protease